MQSKEVGFKLGMGNIGGKHRMPKSVELRNRIKDLGLDMASETARLDKADQTSKYEGLQRNKKGSGYVNFRIVSDNSPTDAFMHPGFQKHDFGNKAIANMNLDHEAALIADGFLKGL